MQNSAQAPIDYLTIGHITKDLAKGGFTLGGTVSFSTLTARAFGQQAAIVTASQNIDLPEAFQTILVHRKPSVRTTTFENLETAAGRRQFIHHQADKIESQDIPEEFLEAQIVHLGSVAQETSPEIVWLFPHAFIGITPQGWMRTWDMNGRISPCRWHPAESILARANAVVFSVEDVEGDESYISEIAQFVSVLAVTEGYRGARVFWNGDVRRFSAPEVSIVDATGAGDIFAAVFFIRLMASKDPWEAGKMAVRLASLSVSRKGLKSVPTQEEIQTTMVEII